MFLSQLHVVSILLWQESDFLVDGRYSLSIHFLGSFWIGALGHWSSISRFSDG